MIPAILRRVNAAAGKGNREDAGPESAPDAISPEMIRRVLARLGDALHRLPVEQRSRGHPIPRRGRRGCGRRRRWRRRSRGRRHRPVADGSRFGRRVPRPAGHPPGRGGEEREPDPEDLRGHRDRTEQGRLAPSRRPGAGPRERPHEELLRPEGVGNDRAAAAAAIRGGLPRTGPLPTSWRSCRTSTRRRARRPKEARRPTPRSRRNSRRRTSTSREPAFCWSCSRKRRPRGSSWSCSRRSGRSSPT